MPPKKKTKKTTKKIQEKEKSPGDNDLEAKYRRSVLDIAVLQDHLAVHCASVRAVQSDRIDLRRRARDMEHKLLHERQDHRDVNSELTRQYRAMQTEMTDKVKGLEREVGRLNEELVLCQDELRKEMSKCEQMEEEKDATIAELQQKLDNMEMDYEKILHETLDSLTSGLSGARHRREEKSAAFDEKFQELLSDFGLSALNI